jgi:hypothetical protein
MLERADSEEVTERRRTRMEGLTKLRHAGIASSIDGLDQLRRSRTLWRAAITVLVAGLALVLLAVLLGGQG